MNYLDYRWVLLYAFGLPVIQVLIALVRFGPEFFVAVQGQGQDMLSGFVLFYIAGLVFISFVVFLLRKNKGRGVHTAVLITAAILLLPVSFATLVGGLLGPVGVILYSVITGIIPLAVVYWIALPQGSNGTKLNRTRKMLLIVVVLVVVILLPILFGSKTEMEYGYGNQGLSTKAIKFICEEGYGGIWESRYGVYECEITHGNLEDYCSEVGGFIKTYPNSCKCEGSDCEGKICAQVITNVCVLTKNSA